MLSLYATITQILTIIMMMSMYNLDGKTNYLVLVAFLLIILMNVAFIGATMIISVLDFKVYLRSLYI